MSDNDALKNLPKLKPRGFAGPTTTEGFAADTTVPAASGSKLQIRTEAKMTDNKKSKSAGDFRAKDKKSARGVRNPETQTYSQ